MRSIQLINECDAIEWYNSLDKEKQLELDKEFENLLGNPEFFYIYLAKHKKKRIQNFKIKQQIIF